MSLVLVGTSHNLSPVEDREQIAVDLAGAAQLAARLANGGEAVCLQVAPRCQKVADNRFRQAIHGHRVP